jgi:hypothetical protein
MFTYLLIPAQSNEPVSVLNSTEPTLSGMYEAIGDGCEFVETTRLGQNIVAYFNEVPCGKPNELLYLMFPGAAIYGNVILEIST